MEEFILGAVFAMTALNTALLLIPALSKAGMDRREKKAATALEKAEETEADIRSREMAEGIENILSYSARSSSRKGGGTL